MSHGISNRPYLPPLLALCALLCVGCSKSPSRAPGVPPAVLSIFYTCDTRGHIEPCSCSSGKAGGLARRMTHLNRHRTETSILVDAGNVTAGPRGWELLEFEYLLQGYADLGYHAVNAGYRETAIAPEKLRELNAPAQLLISANLTSAGGNLVFPPYRIADLPQGYRVGILGVLDDVFTGDPRHEDLTVTPPGDAIARYLPELKEQCDLILLLAFADEEKMKALAERFYEIDVIIGGDVAQPSNTPVEANRSVLVYNTDKGKAVGQLDLLFGEDGARAHSNTITMLDDGVPSDPAMAALTEQLTLELAQMDFRPHRDDEEGLTTITAARSATANKYIEAEQCQACHPEAHAAWNRSKHAHSLDSLKEEKEQFNPECLPCHTTGYTASDGYINPLLTPHLVSVTCGGCHGRGGHHIQLQNGKDVPEKTAQLKRVDCERCHDEENSPNFDFDTYWEKMRHDME